jgi:hypothetical protein
MPSKKKDEIEQMRQQLAHQGWRVVQSFEYGIGRLVKGRTESTIVERQINGREANILRFAETDILTTDAPRWSVLDATDDIVHQAADLHRAVEDAHALLFDPGGSRARRVKAHKSIKQLRMLADHRQALIAATTPASEYFALAAIGELLKRIDLLELIDITLSYVGAVKPSRREKRLSARIIGKIIATDEPAPDMLGPDGKPMSFMKYARLTRVKRAAAEAAEAAEAEQLSWQSPAHSHVNPDAHVNPPPEPQAVRLVIPRRKPPTPPTQEQTP